MGKIYQKAFTSSQLKNQIVSRDTYDFNPNLLGSGDHNQFS